MLPVLPVAGRFLRQLDIIGVVYTVYPHCFNEKHTRVPRVFVASHFVLKATSNAWHCLKGLNGSLPRGAA